MSHTASLVGQHRPPCEAVWDMVYDVGNYGLQIVLGFAFGFGALFLWAERMQLRSWQSIATKLMVLFFIVNVHLSIAFRSGAIYVDGPLYWLDSISHGKKYKAQLGRDWAVISEWEA